MHNSNTVEKLPIVGVMGSGSSQFSDRTFPLGQWLATLGVHLLTGGGRGVMQAVSKAFAETSGRAGKVIGIIPGIRDQSTQGFSAPHGYPNEWVEIPLFTHLPYSGEKGLSKKSRNHINILSSNVIVILPGKLGTAAEAELAVRYSKPVIAWLDDRSQITNLHSQIPVVNELYQVQEFVIDQLKMLNGRS